MEFKEKVQSLQFSKGLKGSTKRTPVIDERDGSTGGYQTEHWDDRQDAHVTIKPVSIKARAQEN